MLRPCFRLISVALVALFALPAFAQTPNGRLSGVIRDSSGAGREGVTVRATNTSTGTTRSATTRGDGTYTISELLPGTYTVSASLIGFRRATQASVPVQGDATVDLVLAALPLQAITVTATLREEELSEVPFSIAAPTAKDLRERGATNIEEIAANVAGFSVQNLGPGQSQVAIRGASAGQIARDQPGVKEQAGVYLDDIAGVAVALHARPRPLRRLTRRSPARSAGHAVRLRLARGHRALHPNQPELGSAAHSARSGRARS